MAGYAASEPRPLSGVDTYGCSEFAAAETDAQTEGIDLADEQIREWLSWRLAKSPLGEPIEGVVSVRPLKDVVSAYAERDITDVAATRDG